MKYKHIAFDIDGTILDTEYAVLHSLQKTIKKLKKQELTLTDLSFAFGITGEIALKMLDISDISSALALWNKNMNDYHDSISVFPQIIQLLETLSSFGTKLGIVTSKTKKEFRTDFLPFHIDSYFNIIIYADDTDHHKPFPDPLLKYIELSKISKEELLYIGDSEYDMKCAASAEIDFALACWGTNLKKHISAAYYLNQPMDLLKILSCQENETITTRKWLNWAMELQFLGQVGITYSKDVFDLERFERIQELSAEILSEYTNIPINKIQGLFCNEKGFQTPKLDTRAAIFEDNKILLVKEFNGTWSLPGGWVDVNQSIYSNTIKEVKEEAGLNVSPIKIIAIQDRNKHNQPIYAYGVCKVFVLCKKISGAFKSNIETTESRYFSTDELPVLAEEKNTMEQIKMCFSANNSPIWETLFD